LALRVASRDRRPGPAASLRACSCWASLQQDGIRSSEHIRDDIAQCSERRAMYPSVRASRSIHQSMALLPAAACSAPSTRTPARFRAVPQMMDGRAVIDEPALRLAADVRPGYEGRRSPGEDAETEEGIPTVEIFAGQCRYPQTNLPRKCRQMSWRRSVPASWHSC